MYINTFKYTPKDVSCQLCTEYVKKLGCTALRCPWLAERMMLSTRPMPRSISPLAWSWRLTDGSLSLTA